ncbi:hypothetical protein WISP_125912 [Willisornis vidua]|uniref:Rna-directed dna polymerase from mobile element jockey-like n=1 Tax=Willisornis vidua TaxID=1566151 RepID=A0ABQ9CX07_9PASS|nr:hypothetical protein WISP_125912 [Willisornis vidua]
MIRHQAKNIHWGQCSTEQVAQICVLRGAIDSLKDTEGLQRDLNKLKDWAITNHMKFKKVKCWLLHLGWGNPGCMYRLENEMLESSAMERNPAVLVNGKLNVLKELTGKDVLPDFLLVNRNGLMSEVEICSCLGQSDHAVEFKISSVRTKSASKTSTLDMRRADFRLYRELVRLHLRPPVLFSIFINDLNEGLEGILRKFAENTVIGMTLDSLREALQRDLNKLKDWAITNHMKFKKVKCWLLHLGWGNPGCMYRLENEMLESSAMERNLGVLANGKLKLSQQCLGSQEGQPCPGGHQTKHCQQVEGEDCPALLCTGAASP